MRAFCREVNMLYGMGAADEGKVCSFWSSAIVGRNFKILK
jgi:hypothetical protein